MFIYAALVLALLVSLIAWGQAYNKQSTAIDLMGQTIEYFGEEYEIVEITQDSIISEGTTLTIRAFKKVGGNE